MTEEMKVFLSSLISVLQEGFNTLEDRCQPSLEWEIGQLAILKEELGPND